MATAARLVRRHSRRSPAPTAAGPLERALWRTYALVYDGLLGLTGYQRLLAQVTSAAQVHRGHRVVEVGCGTGNVLVGIAGHGPSRLVGIDSSPAMLARARRKLAPEVELVRDELVHALRMVPTGSVDRLLAVNVLYALPDRSAFWAEAARVLAPDGWVVATQCDRPGSGPLVREHLTARGWRGALQPRLLAVAIFDQVIDGFARRDRFRFGSFDELSKEAAASGLTVAEYHGRCYGGPQDGVNVLARFGRG